MSAEHFRCVFGRKLDRKTEVYQEGDITRTVEITPFGRTWRKGVQLGKEASLGALRAGRKATGRAVRDLNEVGGRVFSKEIAGNYTVQNILGLGLVCFIAWERYGDRPEVQEIISRVNSFLHPPSSETTITPEATVEATAIAQPLSYTIQPYDTLFSIAQRFGITVNAIMEANPWIEDRNRIYPGRDLDIPGIVSTETPAKDEYRIIVGRPPTYKMTERDISFLNWLNSTHSYWRDWNGHLQRIYVPDWVYQYAKTAEVASEGRCRWTHLVGTAFTETGYFKGSQWNPEAVSRAGARGIMQFMPGTFALHAPYEEADIEHPKDNFIAGCNKIYFQGLTKEETQESWAKNFLGNGPTGAMWNAHWAQANNSWLLFKGLEGHEAMFNTLYEQVINE